MTLSKLAARVRGGEFALVVATPREGEATAEDRALRTAAVRAGVPCFSSLELAMAAVAAAASGLPPLEVRSLQSWEARARC